MLYTRIESINTDNRIRLLHGHSVNSMTVSDDRLRVGLRDETGSEQVITPRLVLGCGGVNSTIKTRVSELSDQYREAFATVSAPSAGSMLM